MAPYLTRMQGLRERSHFALSFLLQITYQLTYEIPDEDILMKNASRFESMVEDVLQCCNQTVFSTQQNGKAPSLRERESR